MVFLYRKEEENKPTMTQKEYSLEQGGYREYYQRKMYGADKQKLAGEYHLPVNSSQQNGYK